MKMELPVCLFYLESTLYVACLATSIVVLFPRDGIRSARQASALAEQSRADDSTLRTSEQEVMRLDFFG